jgi:HlyD family secretion protein
MFRTILLPLLAIAGIVFAAVTVVKGSIPPAAQPPVVEPPTAPYETFVAGSGLIEASSENIAIGAPVGALVKQVLIDVGSTVRKGDPLFVLDARDLESQLKVSLANLKVARQQLDRLRAGTRVELIPAAKARVAESKANQVAFESTLHEAQSQLTRAQQMLDNRALSEEEVTRRRFAVSTAEARAAAARAGVLEAESQLELLLAGTWSQDLDVAETQVEQAQSAIDALQIELDRRTVRAPIDGKVLQRNIREGEFAQAGFLATPLMLMGNVATLHVRVDVDEYEAWRVRANAAATAFARGNKDVKATLQFVRFEPYIVPKRSLTGASTERVDTRVLQVIFSFDPKDLPLYVGQQVDVYIQADGVRRGVSAPAASDAR